MSKSQRLANAIDILKSWEDTVKHWERMGNPEKLESARKSRDCWKNEVEVRRIEEVE